MSSFVSQSLKGFLSPELRFVMVGFVHGVGGSVIFKP